MILKNKKRLTPALFSANMALQNYLGNKTETRRPGISKLFESETLVFSHMEYIEARGKWAAVFEGDGERFNCFSDFGGPGDWLWQRETFSNNLDKNKPIYKADYELLPKNAISKTKWTPAIHAPLPSARLFMLITGVRIEQLNKISEEDCLKEGLWPNGSGLFPSWGKKDVLENITHIYGTAQESYRSLFLSIYKPILIKDKDKTPVRYDVVCWDNEHADEIPGRMGKLNLPVNKIINPLVWVITYQTFTPQQFEAQVGQSIKELTTN